MIDSRRFGLGLCAVTLVTLMSACSGGSGSTTTDTSPPVSNTPPPPSDPTPATVSGIATPSSVSVVTATNSN
jgi:hypothetical protein